MFALFFKHYCSTTLPAQLFSSPSISDQDLFLVPFRSARWVQDDSACAFPTVEMLSWAVLAAPVQGSSLPAAAQAADHTSGPKTAA